ncbi:LysR substrate-binding domain-containing protein [Chromobacterium violaceum]|uniref:D-malate degradation protein R n=2 Tax=Chromobacterium violaceum TaxID=536 RepID=A0A1R0MZ87_CHRVL|nr:LysR substrate-binding domain-containing protein [Chromobacterium violaceum]AAQ58417.1 probable transcriptional regulator, LysR family [Chromobacterium violaceum ATCC 12472]ATP27533.1 LysR family transcriptional regulator [Chromobacterium violaceum]ATP31448.1 LysR family transcriptional regulator [Chromobacterium violaceum]KMN50709.1 LysR family transcriptional regulator [Chromobacterium violaceum]KMN87205.1 LysR family transcriptional regulator [Chromobacterium violaceum]
MASWEGMQEFTAVADCGSFTRAARRLGISIAQVSRQVGQLEERLGARLLYRTTRQLSLTEAGELYLAHCRQLLESLADAEQAVSQLQAAPQGQLKLTAPLAYGHSHISPLVLDFMQRYPLLEVSLDLSNQVKDLVHEGYDLAIRIGRLTDSSLMARKLAQRRHHVCASPDYLARCGEPRRPQDLQRHQCLQIGNEGWHLQVNGRRQSVRVQGRMRCSTAAPLAEAAVRGMGLAQLPDYYVSAYLESGALVEVLADYAEPEEGIWALYPHNRQLSPKVRLLVDFLADSLAGGACQGGGPRQ